MKRRVLVTEIKNPNTGKTERIFGRFDAVKIKSSGFNIISSDFYMYEMTDEQFAKYGRCTGKAEEKEN